MSKTKNPEFEMISNLKLFEHGHDTHYVLDFEVLEVSG